MDLCSQYENGMIVTWIGTEPTVQIRKAHQVEARKYSNIFSDLYDSYN